MHSEDSQNVVKFTTRFWKTYFQSFLWLSLQTMNSTHCPMKRVRCNKLREKRICHLVDGSFVCTFLFRKQDTFFSEKVLYNTVQYSTVHLVTVYLRPSLQMVRIQNGPQFAWNVREWTLFERAAAFQALCVWGNVQVQYYLVSYCAGWLYPPIERTTSVQYVKIQKCREKSKNLRQPYLVLEYPTLPGSSSKIVARNCCVLW